ncbi:MAG TPA: VC0807 family protein [Ilumatobacter sp.]|nr:VC0807 family protein [Ilumatobacter sp.]
MPDPSPVLSAGTAPGPPALAVLFAVLRRLGPQLVEATLVPSLLCYVGAVTVGFAWGVLAAATWTALSIGRRVAMRRQVSGLLVLAAFGLLIRSAVYVLNESAFVYFLQPIARSAATALLFAASVVTGRPLVARFARDFCSFDADVGSRPAIVALFKRLTLLWAGAQAVIAAVHLTLLTTVPISVFIATATGAVWLIIATCVVVTVGDAIRTARDDGLRTVLAHGGRLYALAN